MAEVNSGQPQTVHSSSKLVPVLLTQSQIDSIIEEIPDVPGVGRTPKAIAKRHLIDRVRAFLELIKLYPIKEAFDEFKNEIITSIFQSHVEPGTSVGVMAGVALGGPTTQLSLNSFHFAGAQSGVALAFQRIRDFLTGSKMNRSPEMKIMFRRVTPDYPGADLHDTLHTGTFSSIMALRPEFEQTTVKDVTEDDGIHILTKDEAISAGVPALIDLHAQLRPDRFKNRTIQFPLTNVVELRLNTYRMYTHHITMAMIARAIEGPEPADLLTVVWKSQIEGSIYVLVDENLDIGARLQNQTQAIVPGISSLLLFLYREFVPKLDQFKVAGITNIISMEPQEIDVMKGIYYIRSSRGDPDHHIVYTTNHRTRWDGISLADIHNLFRVSGFKVGRLSSKNKTTLSFDVRYDPSKPFSNQQFEKAIERARSTVKMSELQSRLSNASKIDLMDALTLIVMTTRQLDDHERTPEEKKIFEASAFYYASTTGTNMEEIIWRNDVDHFRTATNHSHEIFEMFGIDAAMVFLILRFRQTLEDFKSFINSRHIALIFGLLCNLGIINSLSFAGINRRRVGPLAMGSYERAFDVFMNSSIYSDREVPVGVSSAIFLGQKSKRVGTGSIAIEQDLTVIPKDPPPLPPIDEETTLDDFTFSDDIIEGTQQAEILAAAELKLDLAPSIDKRRILQSTVISSVSRQTEESILPGGAQVVMASQTLMRALEKVTTGTSLIITEANTIPQLSRPDEIPASGAPQIEDILSLEDLTGLELLPMSTPERARPASPQSTGGLLASLKTVPIEGIQVNATPVGVLSSSTPQQRKVPSMIPPPSIINTPTPPRSTVPEGPASFLSLLPDISEVTAPMSAQGDVGRASISQFLARRQQSENQ